MEGKLEHFILGEYFQTIFSYSVRTHLSVVRYSSHLLNLNCFDDISFMDQSVKKNYSLRKKFLNCKSSVKYTGPQLRRDD